MTQRVRACTQGHSRRGERGWEKVFFQHRGSQLF